MIQIKKKSLLMRVKVNLSFLSRSRGVSRFYEVKKRESQAVFVRAPKHFNIGKQKIKTLNYKTVTLPMKIESPLYLTRFTFGGSSLFSLLNKGHPNGPLLKVYSYSITVNCKFLIKWLEF